jgi:hypothetical protein
MTVTLVRMSDASVEPSRLPSGTKVIAGYIGGNTPHVWTAAEWDRFTGVRKLPIYVHSEGESGITEGWAALQRLYQLNVPHSTLVILDMETLVEPEAVHNFRTLLNWANYRCGTYGSASTVFGNPVDYGYWVADYNGKMQLYPHGGVFAEQYAPGPLWDSSVLSSVTYLRVLRAW